MNPVTLIFSDRPERIAGYMTTARLIPLRSEGSDSFRKDPPNATLSFLEDGTLEDAVVELRDPVLAGNDLSYQIKTLEGTIPSSAGAISLFVDTISMPLTPVSFAAAGRHAWRRAVLR